MTNLKRIRESRGLSQTQLVHKSGVGIKSIQGYEQGLRDINKAQAITLYKIAQVLNCSMEELLEIKKEVEE